MKRKICVVTTTRAEYGLLRPLLYAIENEEELVLQLVVSGTHFSCEFGETYKEIEKDFEITEKVLMDFRGDDDISLSLMMASLQVDMTKSLAKLSPDIVIVLGDRYEIMSVTIASMMLKIPIGHIHGGEVTQGAIDELIRHAITKMSYIHFCATEVYRKRVVQLGENPQMAFNVGSLGVENIKNLKLLSREEFEESIQYTLNKKSILITFHPETLAEGDVEEQFQSLLHALDELRDTTLIFTKANADSGGKIINKMIDVYVEKEKHKAVSFKSLGLLRYLSALQFVDVVVGNSSSGVIEVPSFKIATINIGKRQAGRLMARSIIECNAKYTEIKDALIKAYSKEFQELLDIVENPYESDNTSRKIVDILKSIKLELQKPFYDWEY